MTDSGTWSMMTAEDREKVAATVAAAEAEEVAAAAARLAAVMRDAIEDVHTAGEGEDEADEEAEENEEGEEEDGGEDEEEDEGAEENEKGEEEDEQQQQQLQDLKDEQEEEGTEEKEQQGALRDEEELGEIRRAAISDDDDVRVPLLLDRHRSYQHGGDGDVELGQASSSPHTAAAVLDAHAHLNNTSSNVSGGGDVDEHSSTDQDHPLRWPRAVGPGLLHAALFPLLLAWHLTIPSGAALPRWFVFFVFLIPFFPSNVIDDILTSLFTTF